MSKESDALISSFSQAKASYNSFTTSVESLLRNLIATTGVEPFAFEARTKSSSSFAEKIEREDKEGKYECLEDITDLSGVRIICYLQADCEKITEIIEQEFEIDQENSSVKQDDLDPDKFGYLSTHYVISLNQDRTKLKEFAAFAGMKAELQVRTLLQHTWAAIDWKFRYKEQREAPKPLRRRLFRISALLEAADNEFSQVRVELDDLRHSYDESVSRGDLDIAINSESIVSYLRDSTIVEKLVADAKSNGFSAPEANDGVAISRLIKTCEMLNLHTIKALDERLTELEPSAAAYYKFLSDRVAVSENTGRRGLYRPAVIRYLLIGHAPIVRRQLINKSAPITAKYVAAITEYDQARKSEK